MKVEIELHNFQDMKVFVSGFACHLLQKLNYIPFKDEEEVFDKVSKEYDKQKDIVAAITAIVKDYWVRKVIDFIEREHGGLLNCIAEELFFEEGIKFIFIAEESNNYKKNWPETRILCYDRNPLYEGATVLKSVDIDKIIDKLMDRFFS